MLSILLFAQALRYIAAYDNGVGTESPPMGWSTWCTNDFCGIPDRCSEYEVRRKADAMAEQGMVEMGYKWILLDDCWAHTERDENDELQPSPKLFPSGMPALADYVHNLGMKLGLYTCVGTETCKKGRPGSYGHYETDANTFAKWKIDMVKADNCHRPSNESQIDLYTQLSQALNATGHPMAFAMCNWGEENVVEWGGDISQMYRIQMDHLPMYNLPTKAQGTGYGQGVKQIIDFMADLHPSKYTRPHAWLDPDFLETLFEPIDAYSTMNFTNSRTEMAFWVIWSAPLLVATDPAELSDDKRAILMNEEVLAIHHDPLYISGERVYNHTNGAEMWSRPLENGDMAVILFNSGSLRAVDVGVEWTQLGWNADDVVSVRCLWGKKDLGEHRGGFVRQDLPVHDNQFLRLRRVSASN
jgi:alpha-galactosidase